MIEAFRFRPNIRYVITVYHSIPRYLCIVYLFIVSDHFKHFQLLMPVADYCHVF